MDELTRPRLDSCIPPIRCNYLTLRFYDPQLEASFVNSWSHRLSKGIDERVVVLQILVSLVFDVVLLARGHYSALPASAAVLIVCMLNWLAVQQPGYAVSRDKAVLLFRCAYSVLAYCGLPQWSLHRSGSLLEHVLFASGNTVLLHLAVIQPVLFRTHLLVQPLAYILNAYLLNPQVCTIITSSPAELSSLRRLWLGLSRSADCLFLQINSAVQDPSELLFNPDGACHAVLLFVQLLIGILLASALVWFIELTWRVYFWNSHVEFHEQGVDEAEEIGQSEQQRHLGSPAEAAVPSSDGDEGDNEWDGEEEGGQDMISRRMSRPVRILLYGSIGTLQLLYGLSAVWHLLAVSTSRPWPGLRVW